MTPYTFVFYESSNRTNYAECCPHTTWHRVFWVLLPLHLNFAPNVAFEVSKRGYDDLGFFSIYPTYLPIQPPSTTKVCPLTYAPALLAKNKVGPLKSSGTPHRPAGILSEMLRSLSGLLSRASFMSVAM